MKTFILATALATMLLIPTVAAEQSVVQGGVGDSPVDTNKVIASSKYIPGETWYKLDNGTVKQMSSDKIWKKRIQGNDARFLIPGGGDAGGGDGGSGGSGGSGGGCH